MKELKICVIGAGSTYSPELIDGFFNRQDKMKVKEFALMDIRMDRLNCRRPDRENVPAL